MRFWRKRSEVEAFTDWRRKSARLCDGEFLHGELQIEIREARNLPDTDNFLFNIKRCLGQEKDVTDPYVAVLLDSTKIITTSVIYNNLFPQWNEFFRVSVCHHAKKIIFRVKDQDELGSENLGEVIVSVKEQLLSPAKRVQGWQKIVDDNGNVQGELNINLVYLPYLEDNSSCNDMACSQCYFPLRSGNQVTLYSCARNIDDTIEIPTGSPSGTRALHYTPPSLWVDLFKSLIQSKRFIYIMGWSIYTRIHLLRNDDHKHLNTPDELKMANATLGELLKQKAEEGVRVLLMIWGETTSIMGTHDSETENYFKGSRVFVARVARQTKTKEYKDLDAHFTANLGYSHHQKAVIVDVPVFVEDGGNPNEMVSRIIAFTGGIDITDGRYDTPEHPLFSSLQTTHQKDFYQPCEPTVKPNIGPRMPWHDIHVKLEGPVARDIMVNFVERWGKEQSMNTRLLIQNVEPPSFDLSPSAIASSPSSFCAQVFRSITSDSARQGEKVYERAAAKSSRFIYELRRWNNVFSSNNVSSTVSWSLSSLSYHRHILHN